MKRFAAILALLLLALPRATSAQAGAIYFDDSGPEIMRLGNVEHYEIGFRKSNGAIAYITDKKTGEHVSLGSRHECLWGAWLQLQQYVVQPLHLRLVGHVAYAHAELHPRPGRVAQDDRAG
jgi:hypothetical protein